MIPCFLVKPRAVNVARNRFRASIDVDSLPQRDVVFVTIFPATTPMRCCCLDGKTISRPYRRAGVFFFFPERARTLLLENPRGQPLSRWLWIKILQKSRLNYLRRVIPGGEIVKRSSKKSCIGETGTLRETRQIDKKKRKKVSISCGPNRKIIRLITVISPPFDFSALAVLFFVTFLFVFADASISLQHENPITIAVNSCGTQVLSFFVFLNEREENILFE